MFSSWQSGVATGAASRDNRPVRRCTVADRARIRIQRHERIREQIELRGRSRAGRRAHRVLLTPDGSVVLTASWRCRDRSDACCAGPSASVHRCLAPAKPRGGSRASHHAEYRLRSPPRRPRCHPGCEGDRFERVDGSRADGRRRSSARSPVLDARASVADCLLVSPWSSSQATAVPALGLRFTSGRERSATCRRSRSTCRMPRSSVPAGRRSRGSWCTTTDRGRRSQRTDERVPATCP